MCAYIYTLRKGSFTVGMRENDKSFVFGFKNVIHARSIHYNMSLEPKFELVKQDPVKAGDITAHMASTLFIPKKRSTRYDEELHLDVMYPEEFYRLPFSGVNIILPYHLIYEDHTEYIFRAHVFEGGNMNGMVPL